MTYRITVLAQSANYSCGSYSAGGYSTCRATTSTGSIPASGLLANTGYDILIPMALGLALIIASVIYAVRLILSRNKK